MCSNYKEKKYDSGDMSETNAAREIENKAWERNLRAQIGLHGFKEFEKAYVSMLNMTCWERAQIDT